MFANTKTLLQKAQKGRYAVPAFNVNDLEILQAVVKGAEQKKSPVIVQTSEGALHYAGMRSLFILCKIAAEESKIPIAIHLDHGRNLNTIKKAITEGYSSVMIDGSYLHFKKNLQVTKKVVAWAHKKRVSVEAELGTIGGAEDVVSERKILYTNPDQAEEFVQKTRVDFLAIAVGTSHGVYKFKGKPRLNFSLLQEIKRKVKIPLVLHGASEVPQSLVRDLKKYGATLGKTQGIPKQQIKKAVSLGICKINTDTDLRLAFTEGIRKTLINKPKTIDPRKILGPARLLMQKVVEERIKIFGSANKA